MKLFLLGEKCGAVTVHSLGSRSETRGADSRTYRFLGTLPEDGARSEVEWPGRQWLSGRLSSESSDQVGPASEDAYSAPSQPLHYYPSTTFSPVDFGKSPEHSEVWS